MKTLPLATLTLLLFPATPACIGPAADLVANGAIVGGASDPRFAFVAEPFAAGVVLARPDNLFDLASNVVDDADAVWVEVDGTPAEMSEDGGAYVYDESLGGLSYVVGVEVAVNAMVDGETSRVARAAPPPPDLSGLPAAHVAGTQLAVPLGPATFALAYAVVLDAAGSVVFDDRPGSVDDILLDLTSAGTMEQYVFPTEAFPLSGAVYAVAILAVAAADGADFDRFERFWSNFGVGAVGTGSVGTAP